MYHHPSDQCTPEVELGRVASFYHTTYHVNIYLSAAILGQSRVVSWLSTCKLVEASSQRRDTCAGGSARYADGTRRLLDGTT
eukprot:6465699-Prymnesium_polylepis.1